MDKVFVIHGPNLNMLGQRDVTQYGCETLSEINQKLTEIGVELEMDITTYQSNLEGELINHIHGANEWAKGIVINAGAYTHTSIGIRDAIACIQVPVIEVHLSNVYGRESFRHKSMIAPVCTGVIAGFGWFSYYLGLIALKKQF